MSNKKSKYDLYGKLVITTLEKEVEDAYNNGISLFFPDSPIQHPFNCDGFLEEGWMLRLLIEYKFDEKLSNAVARAKVLVQVLFYMKRFEDDGLALPNVIMVGDRNECFVIHANDIVQYLDTNTDWTTAPSDAADCNPELVAAIAKNETINPFIFHIERGFDITELVNRIRDLSVNVKRYVRVTEHNIAEIFEYFVQSVLRDPNRIEPHDLVETFIGVLLSPMDYYQHPSNRNVLVAHGNRYPIYGDAFISFFDYYNRNYTPEENMKFTEIADRLIEDTIRRRNGEFFTPASYVDYAHRMLEHTFGENWRKEYVVWDASCGTKNLTRDSRFKELYCSTLLPNDLKLSSRYNPEAQSFIFDFLNAPLDTLPAGLLKALNENRPIISFQNPPYGRAGRSDTGGGTMGISRGAADTEVNRQMRNEGMGACSANLYAQFMYRLMKIKQENHLTNFSLGLFTPTLFFSGSSFSNFREAFLSEFEFVEGVQFRASSFADVTDSWGIAFTVWKSGVTVNKKEFPFTLIDRNESGYIEPFGAKIVYNISDSESLGRWVREEQCNGAPSRCPNLSSALNPSNVGNRLFREGLLGTIINSANNVDQNATGVAIFSGVGYKGGNGCIFIGKENFKRACTFFAVKKLILCDWINSKDEYMAPDSSNPKLEEFMNDCLVYTIFSPAGNQSSLRAIPFEDEQYDVKNEFFFMSRDAILELANTHSNMDCYQDARTDKDRFAYTLLTSTALSKEASAVLKKAISLVELSFHYRDVFNMEHPNYQINNWDAGWYQLKALLYESNKKELAEFQVLFNNLSEKLRPLVYELGFLKK